MHGGDIAMWEVIRWVSCMGLVGLFGLILIGNWLCLFGTLQTKKSTSLMLPFFCGPICAFGLWISPSPWLQSWWWVPPLLDISLFCLPLIMTATLFRLLRGQGPDESKPSV
jgi:hypothetical protein